MLPVMIDLDPGITGGRAIEMLFGIRLSKHRVLKDKVNSLLRNGLVGSNTKFGGRNSYLVYRNQYTTLHNAILLDALLPDTKRVKQVFDDKEYRYEVAGVLNALLLERRSIVGISLIKPEVLRFLDVLSSNSSLREEKLANPFETLPQLIFGSSIDLLQTVLAQNVSQESGDAMMAHYLNGDLQATFDASSTICSSNPYLQQLINHIQREYRSAGEFEDLLDFLEYTLFSAVHLWKLSPTPRIGDKRMPSLHRILKNCPHEVPMRHLDRVQKLHRQLMDGTPAASLGGCRVKQSRNIIRFKIGRDWRLLYRKQGESFVPYRLVSRQSFEQVIKRR